MTVRIGEILPHLVPWGLFFLPGKKRTTLERWLRGREEWRKLERADYVIVSWGKSGRTWLRLMISQIFQVKYKLSKTSFLEFDNLQRVNDKIPVVLFTHGNYIRDYTNEWTTKNTFYNKKVILLVRDPRDVAVSQFFQWKYRMKPRKKIINEYPAHNSDISIYDFVVNHQAGLHRVIEFFNGWAAEQNQMHDLLVVRYEDLRTEPHIHLKRMLDFMDVAASEDEIDDAIQFAAYDNMKQLEQSQGVQASGQRMRPGDQSNPDSFKVRRAKVGGYRDYFTANQVQAIDAMVDRELVPAFGYTSGETAPSASTTEATTAA